MWNISKQAGPRNIANVHRNVPKPHKPREWWWGGGQEGWWWLRFTYLQWFLLLVKQILKWLLFHFMAFLDLWKWYFFDSITSYEITVFYSHYSTWMQQLIMRHCAYVTLYLYGTFVQIKLLVLKLAHEVSRADNSHLMNENTEAQRAKRPQGTKSTPGGNGDGGGQTLAFRLLGRRPCALFQLPFTNQTEVSN